MANSTLAEARISNLTMAEERALNLLGQGISPEQTAAAVGLSASRISQLLSQADFAAAVSELRFSNLSAATDRDARYDSLEDDLLERMKDCLPLMVRPHEILKAIQVINSAKRRGAGPGNSVTENQTIINLILPTNILTQFQMNPQNQVIQAGDQPLLTIQSGSLLANIKAKKEKQNVQATSHVISDNSSRKLTAESF